MFEIHFLKVNYPHCQNKNVLINQTSQLLTNSGSDFRKCWIVYYRQLVLIFLCNNILGAAEVWQK